jgi:hypothetical protein
MSNTTTINKIYSESWTSFGEEGEPEESEDPHGSVSLIWKEKGERRGGENKLFDAGCEFM